VPRRFHGIGATLTRRGGADLALVYLQLALYLNPNHSLALLSLADLYESVKSSAMAIRFMSACRRVRRPSAMRRFNLRPILTPPTATMNDQDLKPSLVDPRISRPHGARADIGGVAEVRRLRQTYSQGIDVLPQANEKTIGSTTIIAASARALKQWSKAEADMRCARSAARATANVLNYLGYSWIDPGIISRG